MRNIDEISITAWLTVGMLAIFLPLSMISTPEGQGTFDFLSNFQFKDWFISIAFGISSVFSQTLRAKAAHYEEPAKLTVFNYFQSIIQLAMDILILNTPFTA